MSSPARLKAVPLQSQNVHITRYVVLRIGRVPRAPLIRGVRMSGCRRNRYRDYNHQNEGARLQACRKGRVIETGFSRRGKASLSA